MTERSFMRGLPLGGVDWTVAGKFRPGRAERFPDPPEAPEVDILRIIHPTGLDLTAFFAETDLVARFYDLLAEADDI